jgi:hypothetical protein
MCRGDEAGVRRRRSRTARPRESSRQSVTTCTDLDRLDDWLERVDTVERAEELFGEE